MSWMMRKVFNFRETEPLWRRSLHKGFRYFVSQDTDCIHLSPSVKCIWNAITNWPRDFVQWTTCLYAKEPWKKSQSPKRSIEKYLNLLRPGCISTQKYDIAICWFCLPFNLKTNATKRKGTCSRELSIFCYAGIDTADMFKNNFSVKELYRKN